MTGGADLSFILYNKRIKKVVRPLYKFLYVNFKKIMTNTVVLFYNTEKKKPSMEESTPNIFVKKNLQRELSPSVRNVVQ